MNLCCLFNVIEPKNILGFNAQFIIYRVRKRSLPPPPKMTQNEFSCHFESFLGEGANSTSAPCDLICHQKFSIFKLNLLEFLDYFGQYKIFKLNRECVNLCVCLYVVFVFFFGLLILLFSHASSDLSREFLINFRYKFSGDLLIVSQMHQRPT